MRAAAGLVLAALLLSGCAEPRDVGPLVGQVAPGFEVLPVDGPEPWNLSAQRGKAVLLDLMGVNCAPCRTQMPHLLAVARNHANDSRAAMLSVDMASVYPTLGAREPGEIRAFKAEFNATWPFAPDAQAKVGRAYEPIVIPTLVVIDREGVIRAKFSGGTTPEATLEDALRRAREP